MESNSLNLIASNNEDSSLYHNAEHENDNKDRNTNTEASNESAKPLDLKIVQPQDSEELIKNIQNDTKHKNTYVDKEVEVKRLDLERLKELNRHEERMLELQIELKKLERK